MRLKLINNNLMNFIVSLTFKTNLGIIIIYKNHDKFIGIGDFLYYEDYNKNIININKHGILKVENNQCTFGYL